MSDENAPPCLDATSRVRFQLQDLVRHNLPRTPIGLVCLAAVIGLVTRMVVGWAIFYGFRSSSVRDRRRRWVAIH